MIVADTSGVLGLLDRRNSKHTALVELFRSHRSEWVLPWATLPELDYMVPRAIGPAVSQAFRADLAEGLYAIEWGGTPDLRRALELDRTYRGPLAGLGRCASSWPWPSAWKRARS